LFGIFAGTWFATLPKVPLKCADSAKGNLIARAEKEVFFATNYWMLSGASKFITDGIKELSRRAGERKQKIVIKIMYDRGNLKQARAVQIQFEKSTLILILDY
jgi:hypothetical protein